MTDAAVSMPHLVEVQVADAPASWAAAGFEVDGDRVALGGVRLRLVGRAGGRRGIVGWTLSGIEVPSGQLDGLATTTVDPEHAGAAGTSGTTVATPHPNGVIGLDHVVVLTPDLERTTGVLGEAGLDLRRIRDTTSAGAPMRQAFYRLGPTILEVVSGDLGSGRAAADAPATWFGLAVDVEDLDATAAHLGDGLGPIKAAVQRGRRIATLRHRSFDVSVAVAALDDHADR
jgi:hypothetical protein